MGIHKDCIAVFVFGSYFHFFYICFFYLVLHSYCFGATLFFTRRCWSVWIGRGLVIRRTFGYEGYWVFLI